MQYFNSFVEIVGKNYYLEFLINPYDEKVDYYQQYILIKYQDEYYYEHNFDYVKNIHKRILNESLELYHKSMSEVLINLSIKNVDESIKFIDLLIKSLNYKIKILSNDIFIDDINSRYYSIIYDNFDDEPLKSYYDKKFSKVNSNKSDQIFLEKENEEYSSNYFINTLNYRFLLISSLPFKLYTIVQNFYIELLTLKSDIENKNKLNLNKNIDKLNMNNTYFSKFCNLIASNLVLSESTAIGVMIDLQNCCNEIKSEILLELSNNKINRNEFLEYKINEIQKLDYIKDFGVANLENWLIKYDISLDKILDNKISNLEFKNLIDIHYKDLKSFSPEKDLALLIQTDFYYYFCNFYADYIIDFFKSKMIINSPELKVNNQSETDNTNHLSVNQAVILLDKLGVFSLDYIENLPNTKKAKLVSLLLGKNEKNIKSAIEKLEQKKADITDAYNKDLNKIQHILDNLE
jgi:hypothetical protein